MYCI